MSRIGIIPSAGQATRFGGIPKELLPLPDGRPLLAHAVERLAFCDRVVVVSNPIKVPLHREHAQGQITLMNQRGDGMWGAIYSAMNAYDGDQYYMTMPDTWLQPDAFAGVPECDFAYGYFLTREPERFGVLHQGRFIDKPKALATPAVAWTVLTWSKRTRDLWNEAKVEDYTPAINLALDEVKNGHWVVGPYFDCADMSRYMELLDYLRGKK
jgi:hypothetical protein